jgi:anti-sigma factor RsiW
VRPEHDALAALADGSLPDRQRAVLEARAAGDPALAAALAEQRRALALIRGAAASIEGRLLKAFRTRQTGTGGRPRLVGWPEMVIAQVVKQYAGR